MIKFSGIFDELASVIGSSAVFESLKWLQKAIREIVRRTSNCKREKTVHFNALKC